MAMNGANRAGVLLPPTLPTIKETTLSWLGSELDSSLFSTKGIQSDNDPAARLLSAKNIQRHIDFDDQCLSLKSGEESDFSGIQPLPISSDDTPPTALNQFNRVVQMDFSSLLNESQNRPKPQLNCDEQEEDDVNENIPHQSIPKPSSDLGNIFEILGSDAIRGEVSKLVEPGGSGDNAAVEKLQLIRIWQLMQQEELRRRQEAEIAVLNAQRARMQVDRDRCGKANDFETDPEVDSQDIDDLESGDLDPHTQDESMKESDESDENGSKIIDRLPGATPKNNYDYIPVESAKKSFEQKLEEELRREEHMKSIADAAKPAGPVKRPFLRKGQGLARFKGPPARKYVPPAKDNKVTKEKSHFSDKERQNTRDKIAHKPPNGSKKSSQTLPSGIKKSLQKISANSTSQKKAEVTIPCVGSNTTVGLSSYDNYMQRLQKIPASNTTQKKVEVNIPRVETNATVGLSCYDNMQCFRPATDADLEEFEMLERYAEDDASFFNEPSLVASVLRHDSPSKEENQMSLRDRVRERRRLREEARTKVQSTQNELSIADAIDGNSKNGESPICNDDDDDEILSPLPPKPYFKSPEINQNRVIQRKTASLVRKEKLVRPVARSPVCSPITKQNIVTSNELNLSPTSAFMPRQHAITTSQADQYTDDCVFDDDFEDDQPWGDIDASANIASPRRSKQDDSAKNYKCSDYMEPENEDAENPVRDTDPTPRTPLSSARGLSLSPPPPPTSLMQKLFPGLKVPIPKLSVSQSCEPQGEVVSKIAQVSESPASLLKQKLQELESEISRFKKENAELEKIREKHERNAKNLAFEVEDFRKQKDAELARLEEYKKNETKKLKKERKLFEEHVLATKMLPRKEEREEILKLQEELERLSSDHQSKEHRWNATCNRLRGQISSLKCENEDLQDRIEEMEAQRVKDRKLMKTKTAKPPSVWEAVNDLVDSTVVVTGKDFPKGHGHVSADPRSKQGKAKKTETKSGVVSPEMAISNLRDTLKRTDMQKSALKETTHDDGKVEQVLPDGRRLVVFPNGTRKEISADGKMVKVHFANGDIKEIYGDGSVLYYYHENGTTHTTHPDGLQVFEFPNKQIEHHFSDGTKQITFPDQTVKYLHTDGTEQTVFPDGTEMHIAPNQDKTIVFANGQREIHTNSLKRREYPDGTSKTVFEDGRQETRYASGRLRVKDIHGNVIVDRMTT